jgi:hypothetical protein
MICYVESLSLSMEYGQKNGSVLSTGSFDMFGNRLRLMTVKF